MPTSKTFSAAFSRFSTQHPKLARTWSGPFCIGLIVLLGCLVGIQTRFFGELATLWVANAALFGMFIRRPDWNRVESWVAALAAYIAADLITGSSVEKSLLLTAANMTGVYVGTVVFRFMPEDARTMRHPLTTVYLVGGITAASLASAVVGGIASTILFGMRFYSGFELWFVTELVNTVVILPAVLALGAGGLTNVKVRSSIPSPTLRYGGPLLALAVALILGVTHGGAGAIAFPLPPLLWCAVTFRLQTTTLLTTATCCWLLVAGPTGLMPMGIDFADVGAIASLRLGIAMIGLGPLTVASLNRSWNELNAQLRVSATIDALTGMLNRGAFISLAETALQSRHGMNSVLMLDIDHFKAINDNHGHAVGDDVLRELALYLKSSMRPQDILGRLGGEEFAVVLPQTDTAAARAMAEALRKGVAALAFELPGGGTLQASISIGIATARSGEALDPTLAAADRALYMAKANGRDRVEDQLSTQITQPNTAAKLRQKRAAG